MVNWANRIVGVLSCPFASCPPCRRAPLRLDPLSVRLGFEFDKYYISKIPYLIYGIKTRVVQSSVTACRILNPDITRMGRERGGARCGGRAGRGRPERNANGSVRLEDNRLSYTPQNIEEQFSRRVSSKAQEKKIQFKPT